MNRVAVRTGVAGQCVTFALSGPGPSECHAAVEGGEGVEGEGMPSPRKRHHIKGTVLLSPSARPCAAVEFDAEVRRSVFNMPLMGEGGGGE